MNMQTSMCYRARCICAVDLDKAYDTFGGAAGHWGLLGIALRLAIAESHCVAMEYDRVIHRRPSALARGRYVGNSKMDFSLSCQPGKRMLQETSRGLPPRSFVTGPPPLHLNGVTISAMPFSRSSLVTRAG